MKVPSVKWASSLSPFSTFQSIVSRCHNFKRLTHLTVAGDYWNGDFGREEERQVLNMAMYALVSSSQKTLKTLVIRDSMRDTYDSYQSLTSADLTSFPNLKRLLLIWFFTRLPFLPRTKLKKNKDRTIGLDDFRLDPVKNDLLLE